MSMSDTPMSDLRIDSEMRRPARMNGLLPRAETPIVPKKGWSTGTITPGATSAVLVLRLIGITRCQTDV